MRTFHALEILILDEPTTGLDAFTANNIVTILSNLAKQNKTVILTIHQPRSDIFPLLDTIMLLSQGRFSDFFFFFSFSPSLFLPFPSPELTFPLINRTAYFGPREALVPYFSSVGYPCDIYSNPLDHYSFPFLSFFFTSSLPSFLAHTGSFSRHCQC